MLLAIGRVCATVMGWIVIIVADVKTESGRVDITVTPKEESTEDRLSQDIEDAVKDGFRVRRDDVAPLTESPGDRVQEPKKNGPDTADGVRLRDIGPKCRSMLAGSDGNGIGDPKEGKTSEDEVAPLEKSASGARLNVQGRCSPCSSTVPKRR